MQAAHGRAGVDAEIFSEVRFQSPIGVEGIGLALGDVVGGDQLSPQPFAIGMFGAKHLQARDHGVGTSARDLGLGERGLDRHSDLRERGGERVDEGEFAEVIEERPAPFGQRGRQVAAGIFEPSGGGGVHARVLFGDETPEIAVGVSDVELIARRRRWPAPCSGRNRRCRSVGADWTRRSGCSSGRPARFWSQTASISESTDTARFRFTTSMANTARCFGAPSCTRAPPRASTATVPRHQTRRPAFPIAAARPSVCVGVSSPL